MTFPKQSVSFVLVWQLQYFSYLAISAGLQPTKLLRPHIGSQQCMTDTEPLIMCLVSSNVDRAVRLVPLIDWISDIRFQGHTSSTCQLSDAQSVDSWPWSLSVPC